MIIEKNSHWSNNKMLVANPIGGGRVKRPLQLVVEEGEDIENMDKSCYGSNNWVIVESWHQEQCMSPSYVHDCKHTYKWRLLEKL